MDNTRNQSESCDSSVDLHGKEVPSPSVSINSIYKSKRRTKIDLSTEHEPRSDEVGSFQSEVLASLHSGDNENISYLPTCFGKKRGPSTSRSSKFHQANPKYGNGKKSSSSTKGVNIDEPFDICLSEPLEQDFLEPSMYERNREKQIEAECLLEENGQLLRPGMVLLKNYISLDVQVMVIYSLVHLK